jgi:hypothetical protein
MKTKDQINRELAYADAKLPAARARLMSVPGVMLVNAGIKVSGKHATGQVAFLVYVKLKIPAGELTDAQRIPPVVEGIPTDVIQMPVPRREADVLWGGSEASTGFLGSSSGTLGAIGVTTAANTVAAAGTPVLLTNHHVAEKVGDDVGNGCMCNCCCCECGVIGRVIDTRATADLDASIATLFVGVPYSRAIIGIGAVTGIGVANRNEVVLKYGQTTGLTKGTIIDDQLNWPQNGPSDIAYSAQLYIVPEPPTTDMSSGGDSGSVYVSAETRRIVGLHHSAPSGPGSEAAIACHMTKAAGGGVADELKVDFPNMGTVGAIPIGGAPEPAARPSLLEEVAALRRDLDRSESGQRWLDLLRHHAPEVKHLVNHHRAARVAWQRSQGPAFVAHFLKSARDAAHRVPLEIGGMRAENAVLTMAAVLEQHASAELARAISEHYLTVLQCTQRAESAESLLRNATRLAGVRRGE